MRVHIKVAALVVLLAATTSGTASADASENGGPPTGDDAILSVLDIQANDDGSGTTPKIDISSNIAWIDQNRFSVEVVGEAETEPRGLFNVSWSQRQVAEIELLEMPTEYCEVVDIKTPCYLVSKANEHDELKAPLGAWHVTRENVPDIYTGLPSVGATVNIPENILNASSRQ